MKNGYSGNSEEELLDKIDTWHRGAGFGVPLHEWLGMSWEEYCDWVESGAGDWEMEEE